jgi:hypothetical protein
MKKYGLTDSTKATPQRTNQDYRKEFDGVTKRLLSNDYRTAEEYEGLKRQRVELASRMNVNNK